MGETQSCPTPVPLHLCAEDSRNEICKEKGRLAKEGKAYISMGFSNSLEKRNNFQKNRRGKGKPDHHKVHALCAHTLVILSFIRTIPL